MGTYCKITYEKGGEYRYILIAESMVKARTDKLSDEGVTKYSVEHLPDRRKEKRNRLGD